MDNSNVEIILIEDSRADSDLILYTFKRIGLLDNVIHLTNAEEALDFLINLKEVAGKKFKNSCNLIILDLHLPRIQGEEILKILKENPSTKNIPVVVLTASDDDPMHEVCEKLGAEEIITKPITPDGFLIVIESLKKYWI